MRYNDPLLFFSGSSAGSGAFVDGPEAHNAYLALEICSTSGTLYTASFAAQLLNAMIPANSHSVTIHDLSSTVALTTGILSTSKDGVYYFHEFAGMSVQVNMTGVASGSVMVYGRPLIT